MFDIGFPSDWSTLKKLIWLAKSVVKGGGEKLVTVTGELVSFIANAVVPIKRMKVDIEPNQAGSGDPSPSNVRTVSGWTGCNIYHTGKNMWNADLYMEGYIISSSTGLPSENSNYNIYKIIIPEGIYLLSKYDNATVSSNTKRLASYDANNEVISGSIASGGDSGAGRHSLQFTVPNGAKYTLVALRKTSYNIQLETDASAPTDYEECIGGEFAVTLPAELEDHIGGGELTIHQDGSATFVYKYRIVDGGDQTWTKVSNNDKISFYFSWTKAEYKNDTPTVISSNYKSVSTSTASADDDKYVRIYSSSGSIRCAVKDTANASKTAAQFKTAMTGVQFCALLSEENWTTYELTAEQVSTLVGLNHIWSDGDSVSVKIPESILTDANPIADIGTADNMILLDSDVEITLNAAQSLNMLLGGLYTNNHTADDVSDDEALNIILGGDNA